jgi:hypothetical protein
VPSQLVPLLSELFGPRRLQVYNFGRGYFFSSQERILLEKLLSEGQRPQVAIFIDGLNDFFTTSGMPDNSLELAKMMDERENPPPPAGFEGLALVRLLSGSGTKAPRFRLPPDNPSLSDPTEKLDAQAKLALILRRYFLNVKMIRATCTAFGIDCYFVWQPVPSYHYDPSFHRFAKMTRPAELGLGLTKDGYPLLEGYLASGGFPGAPESMDSRFIDCADIQKNVHEALYVDMWHYSGQGTALLARCIRDGMSRQRASR